MKQNHFELFGIAPVYAVDAAALDSAYRQVQARVHPDKYATASDAERRVAMQWATRANEAYQTLKSPLKRARYLCELAGRELGIESNTAMPADFLMQQMEWRDALASARSMRDGKRLDALERELSAVKGREFAALAQAIDIEHDYADAARLIRQLMFIEKFGDEIGDAIEAMQA